MAYVDPMANGELTPLRTLGGVWLGEQRSSLRSSLGEPDRTFRRGGGANETDVRGDVLVTFDFSNQIVELIEVATAESHPIRVGPISISATSIEHLAAVARVEVVEDPYDSAMARGSQP